MKCMGLILILLFTISCGVNKTQIDMNDSIKKRIDSILEVERFNGVVKLVNKGNVIYENKLGYSNFETKSELNINDQFVIGSISKQITAVLVLQFYENNKLGLTDTISQYLEGINQDWKNKITIHQLLTHTHGIVSLSDGLSFNPGSQFEYSQLGYHLLAKILESISGQSFQELTSDLFLNYNLDYTCHPESPHLNLVTGYEKIDNQLTRVLNSTENYAAAGSIISNANDLVRWNELLYGGELLKKETLTLMETRYATRVHPVFGDTEYGYGLLFEKGQNAIQIGALGYAPGFVSCCYYFPQSHYNLVVLENVAQDIPDFKKCFRTQVKLLELLKKLE